MALRTARFAAYLASAFVSLFGCSEESTLPGGAGGAGGAAGASTSASSGGGGAPIEACACLLGDGPYCGGRVADEAAAAGCTVDVLAGHETDLLSCQAGTWSVLQDCPGACVYTQESVELDDACELPECACFVEVAWCGSGAAKKAATLDCRVPLLPEHDGDILYCPDGTWGVKQTCDLGCVEAPEGTPDYCKSDSEYRLPFDCETTRTCTNGNGTSTHTGKDEYAYDFGMPVGTTIRAMRSGQVMRVRQVSSPGDPCYDGGGQSCANYANTLEILHSDGTVALYMHFSSAKVAEGAPVQQGDEIAASGNSGWSTGPHTHVQIQGDCGIWWCQSIPFAFVEAGKPASGSSVKSQNCP